VFVVKKDVFSSIGFVFFTKNKIKVVLNKIASLKSGPVFIKKKYFSIKVKKNVFFLKQFKQIDKQGWTKKKKTVKLDYITYSIYYYFSLITFSVSYSFLV